MSTVYDTINDDRTFSGSVQDPAMKKKGYGIYALLIGSLACIVLYAGRNSTEVSLAHSVVTQYDTTDLDGKEVDIVI